MMLNDVDGSSFDSDEVETTIGYLDDETLGQLARVLLADGTYRLVRVSELELASLDDTSDATFYERWPIPPSHG